MTVNSYLHTKSTMANLSTNEKDSIIRSITTLQTRLNSYFGDAVSSHFVFGSYSRGTILPRNMDSESDVDYMVIFADGGYQPQAYLDRLKRFVQQYYQTSEITQSHPTIQLTLNHIRFELVPTLISYGQYYIPTKTYGVATWMTTDPVSFRAHLQDCNKRHNWYINPTVRLMKYWNASHGKPFESYELEQMIVNHFNNYYPLIGSSYWSYFEHLVSSIQTPWIMTEWRKTRINTLMSTVSSISVDIANGNNFSAENKIERLLP